MIRIVKPPLKWEVVDKDFYRCVECHYMMPTCVFNKGKCFKYCPNCGAEYCGVEDG